jgi:hypothetical protein
VPDWASAVLEVRSECSDEVDMSGITASVEVRGSEGAMDAPGIVVAAGDVSQAECTGVACAASVPRAGAGKLDSWVQVLRKVGSGIAVSVGPVERARAPYAVSVPQAVPGKLDS